MQHIRDPDRKFETDYRLFKELSKHGNIGMACKAVGIGRSTFYKWRNDDPDFAKSCDEAVRYGKEEIGDFTQGKLFQQIEKGDMQAIKFELERRHPEYTWPRVKHDAHRYSVIDDGNKQMEETNRILRELTGVADKLGPKRD